ncbi:MAG: type IX secretion system outer membrane channel protein PorV [Winogradskyella sp.]|uniref:type IX secretion system outer membrane channel protein PorV n=1 Tax=Winogradskyella sp. TaxID=1883156 RepID=UPI00183C8BBC|nr:type IX secretion system outer membrane channel protein PorV [Winogradskyella sp.]MBT8244057.1 type IX secretion system outer membrane channel protein PorV [Winogradskyella sp.]NNK23507.1 type IX secretion system outer membrane channel protein PorV [Winogradskyella sp.]
MKNILTLILVFGIVKMTFSQETIVFPDQSSVITTGIPFMLVAPDARSAALGDMGVATSVDGFSQQYNPAKYAFSEAKSGFGISFTPYLTRLVNDISISYATYFNRLNEFSAVSASVKYFSLGEIVLTQDATTPGIPVKPNEYAIDVAYSLKLADQFSMAVGLRYFRSALRIGQVDPNANPGSSFGADITGYYQSEENAYNDFNGRWRAGFAIQNLGPKFSYDDGGQDVFQPTNLRLGGGFDFIFDQNSKLALTAELAKLLVPTPPELGFVDTDGDGEQDSDEPTIITAGQDSDVSFLSGVFQSFGDAPGGFSEELKEFTYSLGAEYTYNNSFALRAGYFNESEEKGARKFFALGAGFKYTTINLDLSYLFSASRVQSPLENTLRFSLTFNFGDGEYTEY